MRLILFAALLVSTVSFGQSAKCELTLPETTVAVGDTLTFDVGVGADSELEVSVFADDKVLYYSVDRLRQGTHTYRVVTGKATPGSYFLLVKGEGIHEQRDVVIR